MCLQWIDGDDRTGTAAIRRGARVAIGHQRQRCLPDREIPARCGCHGLSRRRRDRSTARFTPTQLSLPFAAERFGTGQARGTDSSLTLSLLIGSLGSRPSPAGATHRQGETVATPGCERSRWYDSGSLVFAERLDYIINREGFATRSEALAAETLTMVDVSAAPSRRRCGFRFIHLPRTGTKPCLTRSPSAFNKRSAGPTTAAWGRRATSKRPAATPAPATAAQSSSPTSGNRVHAASEAQIRALHAIAAKHGVVLACELEAQFGVTTPAELTIRQASQMIDTLKSTAASA